MESLAGSLFFIAILLVFIASQLFWFRRLSEGCARFVASPRSRRALGWIGAVFYLFLFVYNMPRLRHGMEPTHLTLQAALLEAPFRWWFFSSVLGFALIIFFRVIDRVVGAARWAYRAALSGYRAEPSADPPSSSRRQFLEQTALALGAAPFVAGAYGLFYERLNLETTEKRIALHRLPKAFQGFRIAQLSDIHIGPFMTAEEIRKYVEIANRLKPDLFVLTGDFLTWDSATQEPVVQVLAALKAPFGVFGCLGNHELWTDTENSITRLFAARGVRILRQARVPIESRGETLNLIGVDYQRPRAPRRWGPVTISYLRGIEPLVIPHTANILLSHNPNTFDRAAALGIDLSLAGHTHGGQVTLEFIHPSLTPSRLITRYVKGWFEIGAAQLYVNRGIGTIGVPIRIGSPPEITVFELVAKT